MRKLLLLSLLFACFAIKESSAQCTIQRTVTGATNACTGFLGNGNFVYSAEQGMSSYMWVISSGGSIVSGGTLADNWVNVVWNVAGTQTVGVNYTDTNNCTASAPTVLNVSVTGVPISGPTNVCAGSSSTYSTAPGMTNYRWTVSGGIVTGGGQLTDNTVTVSWQIPGITGSISVNYGTLGGCTAYSSPPAYSPYSSIVVNPQPAAPTVSGNTSSYQGATENYSTDAGKTNYVWSVTGGTISQGSGTNAITVIWNNSGAQSLSVSYLSSGCTASVSKNISVATTGTCSIARYLTGSSAICLNTQVTYSTESGMSNYRWAVSGGTITSGGGTSNSSVTVNWSAAGTGSVSVNYTDTNNCFSSSPTSKSITVTTPILPTITGSLNVCQGSTITYTTQAGKSNYNWTRGPGVPMQPAGSTIISGGTSTDNFITLRWDLTGSMFLNVSYLDGGCSVNSGIMISVNAQVSRGVSGVGPACLGLTANYTTANGKTGYIWTVTGGTIVSGANTNSINVNWTQSGDQSLTVFYDPGLCMSSTPTAFTIPVIGNPTPTISGTTTVCQATAGPWNGPVFTYTTESGKYNYTWTISPGCTVTSGGSGNNFITVYWGTAGSQTLSVSYSNSASCPVSSPTVKNITVLALPSAPTISGSSIVCSNSTNVPYSVAATPNSTYVWTISNGTQVSGSNSNGISVNWGTTTGFISVVETNSSGCSGPSAGKSINIQPVILPTNISGNSSICANSNGATYSLPYDNFSTYAWVVTGGTQVAGTNTNAITVNWGSSGPGNVSVVETANGGCTGSTLNKSVAINSIPVTSAISGSSTVCAGTTGVTYSVTNTTNSTYAWTVSGGTVASGAGTNSVLVNWGSAGPGTVNVVETNAVGCGGSAISKSVTINANPSTSSISGSSTICAYASGTIYNVANTSGSTYVWTITGGTQASGGTSNSIAVNWGASGSGNVKVVETNLSGCTLIVNKPITINANPSTSPITGSASVCAGSGGNYNVTGIVGSTYLWTVSGGVVANGAGTNSILVNWGSAGPGTVSVVETNAAGCGGLAVSKSVTINAIPSTSLISGSTNVCATAIGVPYSVTNTLGSTYLWTIVGGTLGSGINTSSITVNWAAAGSGSVKVAEINTANCIGTTITLPITTIVALPITGAITGNSIVCANSSGVAYSVPNTVGSTYVWTITGGTLVSVTNINSITVNWGAAGMGNVRVTEINSLGCSGAPMNKSVTISGPATSAITGSNGLCANTANEIYSVVNTTGSTYSWIVTGGTIVDWYGTNGNSIHINWGAAGTGNIQVIETNSNGCAGAVVSKSVNISNRPTTLTFTGASFACANTSGQPYSVTNTPGSTYAWSVVGGVQASGGNTNSITVNWGNVAGGSPISGSVSVIETIGSCVGSPYSYQVNLIPSPTTSTITGNANICNGVGVAYSVPNTSTSQYTWAVNGGTIVSGSSTSTITVNWGSGGSGNVSVVEKSWGTCTGPVVNLPVAINTPIVSAPSTSMCKNSTMVLSPSTGGTWSSSNSPLASVTNSGLVTSSQSTGSVTFTFTQTSTGCSSTIPIVVGPVTSLINGMLGGVLLGGSACANSTGVVYNVSNTPGSTYAWSVTGGTQVAGGTTNSITVNWGPGPVATIGVVETNASGCIGNPMNSLINLPPKPITSSITGIANLCTFANGVNYSVVNTPGHYYLWTITGGGEISGANTNSIAVNWGFAGSGNVSVVENNMGCSGDPVSLPVTINANPLPISLNGNSSVCANSNGVSYTATNRAGSTYVWTIAGGTQASGANTSNITVNWGAAGPGTVSVAETSSSGCTGPSASKSVTINALPSTSTIMGISSVCANTPGTPYSVTNTPGSTYVWTITGGTPASGSNTNSIVVNWGVAGPGNVKVVETNSLGCVGTAVNKSITINALPLTSAISGNASVCANASGVSYSVTNTTGSTYVWTITGGTPASGSGTNSITVNWGAAGPGNVKVIETNSSGCVGAAVVKPVTINALPSTSSISGTGSVCANSNGISYSVTNTTGSTYVWTISGGTPASGSNTNSITMNWGAAGPGNVSVVETNSSGCVGTAVSKLITINPLPSTSPISGNTSLCPNTSGVPYSVTNTPGSTYVWTITGGAPASGSSTNSITVNWGAAGPGNVRVVETNSLGCVGAAVDKSVTINALPSTSAISGNPNVCVNASGTSYGVVNTAGSNYAWSISGGNLASGVNTNNITVNWGAVGSGNVSVLETNSSGCVATAPVSKAVTINGPPIASITASGSTTFCQGGAVTLTASTGASYLWSTGATTQSIGVTTSGNYSVTVYSSYGCSATSGITSVTVNTKPTLSASTGPTTICYGGSTSITFGGNFVSYSWTPTAGVSFGNFNVKQATLNPTTSTEYAFTGIDANGCTSDPIIDYITVNPLPNVTVSTEATTICPGLTTNIAASGASSYRWTTGATTASIWVSPSSTTTYTVTGTTNGCSATASSTITVKSAYGYASPGSVDLCTTGGCTSLMAGTGSGYHWSTGATSQSISVCISGTYTVTYTNNGCAVSGSAYVYKGTSSPSEASVNSTVDNWKGGSDYSHLDPSLQSGFTSQQIAPTPCSGSSSAIQVESNEPFRYYPNPASGEITIVLTKVALEDAPISWYDMSGHQVRTDVIEKGKKEKQFRLDEIANGMYLVQVKDNDRVRYAKILVAK